MGRVIQVVTAESVQEYYLVEKDAAFLSNAVQQHARMVQQSVVAHMFLFYLRSLASTNVIIRRRAVTSISGGDDSIIYHILLN